MAFSSNGGATYLAAVAYAATGALALPATDGLYTVAVRVTDIAGNSQVLTQTVRLDQGGPAISNTMTAPTNNGSYDVGTSITFTFGATDVDNVPTLSATLDATTALTSGQKIDVNTLNAGTHTIVISAADQLGNTSSVTITFQVHATVSGQINAVNQGVTAGLITAKVGSSLVSMLNTVQSSINAGNPAAAKSALTNYMNYVKSQSGTGINAAYATRLVNWAQDLYNRL